MKDDLGDRMKDYYESRSKTRLIRRMPVIIRLDGKAFHTFTKGFEKPFDMVMVKAMQETMNQTLRGYWCIDDEIPIFKDEGRDYIEKLL